MAIKGQPRSRFKLSPAAEKNFFAGRATRCITRPNGIISPTRSRRASVGRAAGRKIISQGGRNDKHNVAVVIYCTALDVFRPRPRNSLGSLRRLCRLSSTGLGAERLRLVYKIWLQRRSGFSLRLGAPASGLIRQQHSARPGRRRHGGQCDQSRRRSGNDLGHAQFISL